MDRHDEIEDKMDEKQHGNCSQWVMFCEEQVVGALVLHMYCLAWYIFCHVRLTRALPIVCSFDAVYD